MYAIVETGGRQIRVETGQIVEVERLAAGVGQQVELQHVLLMADDERMTVGQPVVEGARVRATVLGHGRGRKIIVFKYKPKNRYRRKSGHRQDFTRLRIDEIVA